MIMRTKGAFVHNFFRRYYLVLFVQYYKNRKSLQENFFVHIYTYILSSKIIFNLSQVPFCHQCWRYFNDYLKKFRYGFACFQFNKRFISMHTW